MSDFPECITRLPELDIPFDGVSGHLLQGKDQQVALVRFEDETVVPEHSHAAQWELVVAGELRLTVDGVELVKIMPPLAKKPGVYRRIGIDVGWKVTPCNNIHDAIKPINYDYYIEKTNRLIVNLS